MQHNPYITTRLLPEIIRAHCEKSGIQFQSFSDGWVLRLEKAGVIHWVVSSKFSLNSSSASELAQDKVATYAALHAAGIAAIEHYLVRSLPHEAIDVPALTQKLATKPVVIKPLQGTGGRDVHLHTDIQSALHAIRSGTELAWAISPHYEIAAEYRLVLLDDEVLVQFEKTEPTFRGELKLFNLGYGAIARDINNTELARQLYDIAHAAMQAMTLRLASVDIVRLADGSLRIIEVNDSISLEHYARQSSDYKNRAVNVYGAIVSAMFA